MRTFLVTLNTGPARMVTADTFEMEEGMVLFVKGVYPDQFLVLALRIGNVSSVEEQAAVGKPGPDPA